MKKSETILLVLFIVLFSCNRDGFSHLAKNVEYKLISFESELGALDQGDLVILDMGYVPYVELSQNAYVIDNKTGLQNILREFSVGDSIILRLDPDFFQFGKPSEEIEVGIKIKRAINADKQVHMNSEFSELKERALISQFLIDQKLDPNQTLKNGVYFINRPGLSKSEKIKPGDQVAMSYITQYLSGVELANSSTSQTLDFTVGQEEQVLPGVERAIEIMRFGEKLKVLIPSELAYGDKGSVGGLVPSYTPLLMELQFQKIMPPE